MTKTRVVRSIAMTGLAFLVCAATAFLQASPSPDTTPQLLRQARESLGMASRINAIKSLAITGAFTKVGAARSPVFSPPLPATVAKLGPTGSDEVGNIKLYFMLPNQFRQDYTYLPNGVPAGTTIICRNGDDIWLDNRASDSVPSGMSVSMSAPPAPDSKIRRSVRFAQARYLLALLLYTEPSFPVHFQSAGKAEAPDGRADTLDVEGPDGFAVRLFLDEKTHRPLFMSYTDPSSGKSEKLGMAEYQESSGILFPHLLSRTEGGKLKEELHLEKFVVDSHVDARDFRK